MKAKHIHYAWVICAACTLLLFITVGLANTAFSVHQPYLITIGGLSNTQSSLVITLRTCSSLFPLLLCRRVYQRTGIRQCVTLAMAATMLSFLLFGIADNPSLYYTGAVLSGIGIGLGGMIPVSVLIDRWFKSQKVLALGICTAGTGLSAVIIPPLVTTISMHITWKISFFVEMGFCALAILIVRICLRNRPEDMHMQPLCNPVHNASLHSRKATAKNSPLSRSMLFFMCIAVALIGVVGNVSCPHLSVLYRSEGFPSSLIALLLSISGLMLTMGKCLYGWITDRIGAYRSGYLFFSLIIVGEILCCFAPIQNTLLAISSMLFLSLGLPLASVGISVSAQALASDLQYERIIHIFQVVFQVGALVFGLLPGWIADTFHSYIPFYILMVIFALISGIITQTCIYLRQNSKHAKSV